MADPGAELRQRGFVVLDGLYDEAEVAFLRGELEGLWRQSGAHECWAGRDGEGVLGPDLERWVTGLVFKRYLSRRPEMARLLVKAPMVEALAAYLGEPLWIESSTAVVSDRRRPLFRWHSHVGGIDEERFRERGESAVGPRPERVSSLLYLQPVDESEGQLWVYPRRVSDPTAPPHDPAEPTWPGRVAVRCPAGSVVLMDQATFHMVEPRSAEGLRMFVGAWFGCPAAPAAERWDDSLDDLEHAPPELRALAAARPR